MPDVELGTPTAIPAGSAASGTKGMLASMPLFFEQKTPERGKNESIGANSKQQ